MVTYKETQTCIRYCCNIYYRVLHFTSYVDKRCPNEVCNSSPASLIRLRQTTSVGYTLLLECVYVQVVHCFAPLAIVRLLLFSAVPPVNVYHRMRSGKQQPLLSLSHDAARTTFDFSPQSPVRNLLHVSVEVGSVKTSIMVDFNWRVLSNRFEVVLWHFPPAFVDSQCDGPLSLS